MIREKEILDVRCQRCGAINRGYYLWQSTLHKYIVYVRSPYGNFYQNSLRDGCEKCHNIKKENLPKK